ncbi:MAG: lysophospholipid acyltransferase family protein [Planctomycetota bacterium]
MRRFRWTRRLRRASSMMTVTLCSHVLGRALGWLRLTYRRHIFNDHRDRIIEQTGRRYVFAILHAHQLAALSMSEAGCGTMVSRSRDGDLLVPSLRSCSLVPIRGSSGTGRKGGATALVEMIRHVRAGHSAVIAVDGPRGPRGKVQPGAAMVAHKADVPVLPIILIPNRRWIMGKTWDRMQILTPFCSVRAQFGDPIYPTPERFDDPKESVLDMSRRIESSLREMESRWDPTEADFGRQNAPASPSHTSPATGLSKPRLGRVA